MDSALAISSRTVAVTSAAHASSLFAALFAPPFVWTLIARRPTPEPSRPTALSVLTITGSFFRGPGYNWTWPWAQGVFFEL